MELAYIPSPSQGEIHLGPIPLRGYALAIVIGVIVAIWIGERRWVARGGTRGTVGDIAIWAVPFGLVGARLYHVVSSPDAYFGENGEPIRALYIWEGGLGVWGAVALGAVGAWIGLRLRKIPFPAFADALAPGIAVAQAIGRLGNWFNQELYGRPTELPWAVRIDADHRPPGYEEATYHPTFLYEMVWNLGVAVLVVWADRRFRLGYGRAFALYVMAYTAGRSWIEYLRIDEAHEFAGLRVNNWVSFAVFLGAAIYFVVSAKLRPGREEVVEPRPDDEPEPDDEGAEAGATPDADSGDRQDAESGEPQSEAKDSGAEPEPEAESKTAVDEDKGGSERAPASASTRNTDTEGKGEPST